MRKNKAELLLRRSRGRRDIAVAQNVYVAVLEPGRRGAKDKVDVTGDVAVFKILPPPIQKNRVLPSQEAAVAKRDPIAIDANGQRLAHWPGRILKGKVLNREIVGIDKSRRRTKGADRLAVNSNHVGVQVVRQYSLLRIFTDEMNKTLFVLCIDQLLIDAWFDMNDCGVVEASCLRHGIDGFLNRL